jgi:putative addiction module component (TIGR02574 family)
VKRPSRLYSIKTREYICIMTKTEIKKQAMGLPLDERLELAEKLLSSMPVPTLTTEQEAELDRRGREYVKNPASAIPAEVVHKEINTLLKK